MGWSLSDVGNEKGDAALMGRLRSRRPRKRLYIMRSLPVVNLLIAGCSPARTFQGGEIPGYNSFMGYDPANQVTLVVWTNLTVSLDDTPTTNALMLKVLD